MRRTRVAPSCLGIIKKVKEMDEEELRLLNMSQEEMERIANGDD